MATQQTLIIYDSKYGFSEQYARWIADELNGTCLVRKEVKPEHIRKYDTVIFGGGIYAGHISGLKWFVRQISALKGKKLIIFTCGLADPADPENTAHIRSGIAKILTEEQLRQIPLFHFRGGIDYARLSFIHKCMMEMMYRVIKKQYAASGKEEDRIFLENYGKKTDYTSRDAVKPLVDSVR